MRIFHRAAPLCRRAIAAACALGLVACSGMATQPAAVLPATPLATTLAQIRSELSVMPASVRGNNAARSTVIRALDDVLGQQSAEQPTAPEVVDFYRDALARVAVQIPAPVTEGARVWMLYNKGFLVKTASTTFAFDVVSGKAFTGSGAPAWDIAFPAEILDRIDVLFVTHLHPDHYDAVLAAALAARGKTVVCPRAAGTAAGCTVWMDAGESATIAGLLVHAWDAPHPVPTLMYEVVTAEKLRVLNTGDACCSASIPRTAAVDLLLLNAWMNEDNAGTNRDGMTAALLRVQPRLMIPGHLQELSHPLPVVETGAGRYGYENALKVQADNSLPGKTVVLAWGEHLDLLP